MTKPQTLSPRQLNRATLARQMLLQRADIAPVAAVERLMGMQAQEPRPPAIGLWSRLDGFRRNDLHRALHEREIVRGTLMRGTLHLFSAADFAAFRMTLQPVLNQGIAILGDRAHGFDLAATLARAREILEAKPRTFNELRTLLVETFPAADERALGFTVRMLLPLVMVPTVHPWAYPANSEFALAERWLAEPLAPGDAAEALVSRYLAAFGPATAMDMQTWSGLKGMKPVLAAMKPRLSVFTDERSRELFDLPDAPRPDAGVPAPPRFLPEFDNLLLSHADRTRVIADEHRSVVYQKGNLRLLATILVDGTVSGIWRVDRKGKAATLRITPFAPLPPGVMDELRAEGEALLRFVEEDAAAFAIDISA